MNSLRCALSPGLPANTAALKSTAVSRNDPLHLTCGVGLQRAQLHHRSLIRQCQQGTAAAQQAAALQVAMKGWAGWVHQEGVRVQAAVRLGS